MAIKCMCTAGDDGSPSGVVELKFTLALTVKPMSQGTKSIGFYGDQLLTD